MQNRSFNTQDSQIHSNVTTLKYKLVFLGDQSVGKTSILNRFIFDTFDGKDNPTVGIDFISKTLYYDDRAIKLQLWDTAGQERFRSLIPSYIRDCSAAIIIYDVSNEASFKGVAKWIEDVRGERGTDVVTILVANKVDLEQARKVTPEEGESSAKDLDIPYMEVSAKTGYNIQQLFQLIANNLPGNENNKILKSERQNTSNGNIKLDRLQDQPDDLESYSEKKCSC